MAELLDADDSSLFDFDDKRRLNLTQSIRERIVTAMLSDGKLPEDEENRNFLLKAIDGMDRQTLSKANVKSKDKANDASKNIQEMVTQLLLKTQLTSGQAQPRLEAPTVPLDVVVNPVPGEMDMAGEQLNYDDFIKKFE